MPHRTWHTKADFDDAYSIGAEGDVGHPSTRDEIKLNYHRAVLFPRSQRIAGAFERILGWTVVANPSIVIVGAGFGWTVEALEAKGYTRVVGTDMSTYIQDNQDSDELNDVIFAIAAVGLDHTRGEGLMLKNKLFTAGNRRRSSRGVLNETGDNNQSRGRIKQALGLRGSDTVDFIVTESVIESLEDAEVILASNAAHNYGNVVGHYVMTARERFIPEMNFNVKSLAEWERLLPGDIFIPAGSSGT